MQTRIEELCANPGGIIGARDLSESPVTPQEILDCLLLTAALAGEHTVQITRGMEALAACEYDWLNSHCAENLLDLHSLPEDLKADPELLTDYVDAEDRLRDMTAVCQALRGIAVLHPEQAGPLHTAADIMEAWWTPLTLDD